MSAWSDASSVTMRIRGVTGRGYPHRTGPLRGRWSQWSPPEGLAGGYPAGGIGPIPSDGGSIRRTPPVVPIDGASGELGRTGDGPDSSPTTKPRSTYRPTFWENLKGMDSVAMFCEGGWVS